MKVSEIRLHGVTVEATDPEHCHWCGATLDGKRNRTAEPRYAIDAGRRTLVEIEVCSCVPHDGGWQLNCAFVKTPPYSVLLLFG